MKTVFINGSPKKKLSVSSYLLGIVRLLVRGKTVKEQVRNSSDHKRVLESIKDADTVVFGLPLFVDGVPSHILTFMKEMEKFCAENDIHPNVYVVSNGGFIEGCQNRALMQVFENFCVRCNCKWCGGVGIGGLISPGELMARLQAVPGVLRVYSVDLRTGAAGCYQNAGGEIRLPRCGIACLRNLQLERTSAAF